MLRKGKKDKRPNIIFILLDNVGKDWFRSYGSEENQTRILIIWLIQDCGSAIVT